MCAPFCFPLSSLPCERERVYRPENRPWISMGMEYGGIVRHRHAPLHPIQRRWLSHSPPILAQTDVLVGGRVPGEGSWILFLSRPDEGPESEPEDLAAGLEHLCSWCVFNFILFGISRSQGEVNHGSLGIFSKPKSESAARRFLGVVDPDGPGFDISTLPTYVCRCASFSGLHLSAIEENEWQKVTSSAESVDCSSLANKINECLPSAAAEAFVLNSWKLSAW